MDNVLFIPTQASLISTAYRAQADILPTSLAYRALTDILSLAYRAHSWPKLERGDGDLSQPLLTLL